MTTAVTVDDKGIGHIDKDPNAILDYVWDWSAWLNVYTDTIQSVTFPSPVGVTVNTTNIISIAPGSANAVRAWISGGVLDEDAEAVCRIVTAGGRTEDRTLRFKIRER